MTDTHISERYEFRNIKQNEAEEAAEIERICFPPNEACSKKHMKDRVAGIADLFLVVIDKENGKMAGFLNGLATDEVVLKDEFFTDAGLHNPEGKNIFLLAQNHGNISAHRLLICATDFFENFTILFKELSECLSRNPLLLI